MCSVIVLFRPAFAWPLLLAGNRDELTDRPWLPPGPHWPDRPQLIAGMDLLAGGSWLGINRHGLVAAILNRRKSLGPQDGKRSRGELVLEALDHAEARDAAEALSALDPHAYRSFNMVVADSRAAFWLRNRGDGSTVESMPLPPGLSFITAEDRNDMACPRIRGYLPRFQALEPPDPGQGDWQNWETLLASRLYDAEDGPQAAMTIVTPTGFGTVSSSIIALPAPGGTKGLPPIWRFAAGRPDQVPFTEVTLPAW